MINLSFTIDIRVNPALKHKLTLTSIFQKMSQIPSTDHQNSVTDYCVTKDNITQWYNGLGQLHRVGGPAIERTDGTIVNHWLVDGVYHREDGPAIECGSYMLWYKNGQLHREDGPAIIRQNGQCMWFINGKQLSKMEFFMLSGKVN